VEFYLPGIEPKPNAGQTYRHS